MMISFIARARAAWTFTRHQRWVDPLPWRKEDANALNTFFKSDTGKRFRDALLNTVLMQNASAITDRNHLQYSSGFAMGQASLVKVIEVMADQESITGQDDDPDSATNT
jgi:hypothetical protein